MTIKEGIGAVKKRFKMNLIHFTIWQLHRREMNTLALRWFIKCLLMEASSVMQFYIFREDESSRERGS